MREQFRTATGDYPRQTLAMKGSISSDFTPSTSTSGQKRMHRSSFGAHERLCAKNNWMSTFLYQLPMRK